MTVLARRLVNGHGMIYLLLGQVVRQVGNHDLVLGGNSILGGTTLARLTGGTGLLGSLRLLGNSSTFDDVRLVAGSLGSVGKRKDLVVTFTLLQSVSSIFRVTAQHKSTHATRTTTTATATTATATTATRVPAATTLFGGLTLDRSGLLLVLGLASKLNGDLAAQDFLARKLANSTLGLGGS